MGDNEYILFYSNKCLHCKEFINQLVKDNQLNQKFTKICVDNPGIKIPAYIKSVPSSIIVINGKAEVLTGNNLFKWFNQRHAKTVESQGILDWDPQTMAGFSDGFSYLENGDKTIKRSFAFLNDNNGIDTPNPDNYVDTRGEATSNGGNSKSDMKKKQFDSEYESFLNQRKHEVPASIPRL